MSSEFAEVIFRNGYVVEHITLRNDYGVDMMKDLLRSNLDQQHILVLDLHNVTDLFDPNAIISSNQICVLSFVGRSSETRKMAREDVIRRITTQQVKMGILIFERPKQKVINKSTTVNDVHGTKAWTIDCMNECLSGRHFYFVDDSDDHIELTNKHLGNKGNIYCYLTDGTFQGAKNAIDLINNKINYYKSNVDFNDGKK